MVTRIHYWNCSKFADFVRGSKKPQALEWKEWDSWHKEAKRKHPIRYWIAENFLKKMQNLCCFPSDLINKIIYYYENRFISKTHCLKTGLKPGKYYELDQRILYGLFNELVEFVESEAAWMNHICSKKKKYKFKKGKCPEAGIDYFKWASRLKQEGKPTQQAISARKILKLYNWWKKRPERPDPSEASGWSDHCESKKSDSDEILFGGKASSDSKKILEKLQRIEDKYEKEDEKMLIELIKIRLSLWT